MTWLAWRQFRAQALAGAAGVLALTATVVLTRPGSATFADRRTPFIVLDLLMLTLPGLLGLFWGAPLIARELETGTHRLAWSQSVSRTRWLAVKLGVVVLGGMAVAGLASLAVSRWAHGLDALAPGRYTPISPLVFAARGIVPAAYAAFAVALGALIGLMMRRTVPAIAVTLIAFVGVQVAVPLAVRPHLLAPVQRTLAITQADTVSLLSHGRDPALHVTVAAPSPRAWVVTNETVNGTGRVVDALPTSLSATACGADGPVPRGGCFARIAALGYRQHVAYEPARRFWALQWREAGLYLLLSALLAAASMRAIRRVS